MRGRGDGLMVGEPDLPSPLRFVVLASGNGGNFQALVDACAGGRVNGRVAALVSDRKEAFALERAARAGIPGLFLPHFGGTPRREYDAVLAETTSAFRPDYVLLLGWMRILSDVFISRFPMRVVNIHPALPGAFPGTRAIERAFEAWRQGRIDRTGVMIHFVPDEGVDDGPVISAAEVAIEAGDDPASLEKKVHEIEHRLLTETLARLAIARDKEYFA
ncbi:MAG: phosphoribosylglycinamide formyltransferase [Rectinemataceae bacterium]